MISTSIETPLGPMLAVADTQYLYLLEFTNQRNMERQLTKLSQSHGGPILPGHTPPIQSITQELQAYFEGRLKTFQTPLKPLGSPFQQQVWQELLRVPYGQTRSYATQAQALGKQTAYRAVANANGANQIAIVIPCHRIINSNGLLGGYAGGLERKKWLLEHEQKIS